MIKFLSLIATAVFILSCSTKNHIPKKLNIQFELQQTSSNASLRGLSAVNEKVAWASGSQGTILKTIDGGLTWQTLMIEGAETTDFRDIEAFDAETAVVMGIASPARFFKTTDGGHSWQETYSDLRENIFFDAMDFWDEDNGIAFSDAVDGKLVIVRTQDGGDTWAEVPPANIPDSPEGGEGGFAASGTCIFTFGESHVWIGLGSPGSRIFYSKNKGLNWEVVETPMKSQIPSAGIFSLLFFSPTEGIAVGGDYANDTSQVANAAISDDGGESWRLVTASNPSGFRSAVDQIPGSKNIVAVGTSGSDYSVTLGKTWSAIDTTGYHAISFGNSKEAGWVSGSNGRIAKVVMH